MKEKFVLGLDLGTNSIGWALVSEKAQKILAAGVRVFPEGVDRTQTGAEESKNLTRRTKRGMRRQIARRAKRKKMLRRALVEIGLLPKVAIEDRESPGRKEWETAQQATPYELRAKALTQKLEPYELGRVFLHLAQRRGFLSNRKVDSKEKSNSDMLKEIEGLAKEIDASGEKSLGAFLAKKMQDDRTQRVRGRHTYRKMYLDEFDAIWKHQQKYHPALLTDQLKYGTAGRPADPSRPGDPRNTVQTGGGADRLLEKFGLFGMIFFQRKIYWPKSIIGQCELNPKEARCHRADRLAQRFRMLLEINNLKIIRADGEIVELDDEQREALIDLFSRNKEVPFAKIRKELELEDNDSFNLENGDRKKLQGMETDAILANKKYFGKDWWSMDDHMRTAIVTSLINDDEPTFLKKASEEFQIAAELADALLTAPLPEGRSSYGRSTIQKLLPHLEKGLPLSSSDGKPCAIREAGFLLPWERDVAQRSALDQPPAVTNPIVRQALFEVRKVVNAIVREYGKPVKIRVEMARETRGTAIQRANATKRMRERQKLREDARAEIENHGITAKRSAIEKYLLWKEQKENCMYSGDPISLKQLLEGEVDVDHILPYSRSLDDSQGNKVVCFRSQNQDKGNRTVHEWLADSRPEQYQQVLQRAQRLPEEVRNLKLPRFAQKNCELTQFINRQLTDTAYITTVVLEYLKRLGVPVIGSKGQLTAELRHQWGLNSILNHDGEDIKNREDHRHHAVDAIVIALTDEGRLHALAKSRGQNSMPRPWDSFFEEAQNVIGRIIVSHRASRKIRLALHEETIYGATQKVKNGTKENRPWAKNWIEEEGRYVVRKELKSLTLAEVERIRDDRIRQLVLERLAEHGYSVGRKPRGKSLDSEDGKNAAGKIDPGVWQTPLILTSGNGKKAGAGSEIKRVRIYRDDDSIRPLGESRSKYVKPGNTHHVAVFQTTDSKGKVSHFFEFVSMIEAIARIRTGKPVICREHSAAKFLFSMAREEMFQGSFQGGPEKIVCFSTASSGKSRQAVFVEHFDARKSKAKQLTTVAGKLNLKKIFVDVLGQVFPASD